MAADPLPARHDLVWLAPGWRRALAAPVEGTALSAIETWFRAGRPAVACRREGIAAGAVALGIALPPGAPVRRPALLVDGDAVARVAPPLALAEALASAPGPWRGPLAMLEREAQGAGLMLRVYGSLAWEHLSGERYLTGDSDVDLLVAVQLPEELRRALRLLAARAAGPPRLDGEVLLPGGHGVAWRELATRSERVLVKSADAVALQRTRDVLGALAEGLP